MDIKIKNFLKTLFSAKAKKSKPHFETSTLPYPDIIEFEGDDSLKNRDFRAA